MLLKFFLQVGASQLNLLYFVSVTAPRLRTLRNQKRLKFDIFENLKDLLSWRELDTRIDADLMSAH